MGPTCGPNAEEEQVKRSHGRGSKSPKHSLVRWRSVDSRKGGSEMRIGDLMTTDVVTIGSEASLKEAARRMLKAGVSGLPVTEDGNLVGIITEADFVSEEAERRPRRRAGLLRFFAHEEPDVPSRERNVGDVMTRDVYTVTPDDDHVEAARLMESTGVKRLPVVEDGKLVGIVSRSDLLKAFVRPDTEIIEELKERVMRKVLWIDPDLVDVQCVDGNLVLSGHLETRSDATLLVELAGRLDGVVSVEDHLTWEIDNTKLEMVSPPPDPRRNWISDN